MKTYDILKYRRSIEIWDTIWYDDITKIRRKLLKLDRTSTEPIIIQISGENEAKSESMVLFDLMQMIQSEMHTVAAGGLEGLNGLLFLTGNVKVAYPNMWLKPWWPVKRSPENIDNAEFYSEIIFEKEPSRLDENIIGLFAKKLGMSFDNYRNLCFSQDALLANDLLRLGLIDTIIHKDSNWLVNLLNNDI